jgi:hypothetical protein
MKETIKSFPLGSIDWSLSIDEDEPFFLYDNIAQSAIWIEQEDIEVIEHALALMKKHYGV